MIIAIGSVKGGVGKTNTAIHVAAFFQTLQPTLLVDSDRIRASLLWSKRGNLDFTVVDENHQAKAMRATKYEHIVFDTEGSITDVGLRELATGADLLIIPAIPEASATDGLVYTLQQLKGANAKYKVLLNRVKHNRPKEAIELKAALEEMEIPIFKTEIPDLAAFDKASAQGIAVHAVQDNRSVKAWESFVSLGREIQDCV
jgi:chromosome partitioning protein